MGRSQQGFPGRPGDRMPKSPEFFVGGKLAKLGSPDWSREESEGAVGVGSLGTRFQFRGLVFLKGEEFSITGCSGRGWALQK